MFSEPTLEDRLLGGILRGLAHRWVTAELALASLEPRHFVRPTNRCVFATITNLRRDGAVVDLVTVADRLHMTDQIEEAGGYVRLCELWEVACVSTELPILVAIIAQVSESAVGPPAS
jgi:replicative DNA helicase